jgi:hypothetical protein
MAEAKFYANPYDSSAKGFYFESPEEYEAGVEKSRAEEFEIELIDGDEVGRALAEAVKPSQADIEAWYDLLDEVDGDSQLLLQIVGFAACDHDLEGVSDFEANRRYIEDTSIEGGTLEELAERFVEEGIITDLEQYFDYDKFTRDLEYDGYSSEYLLPSELEGSDEAKEELGGANHYVFLPDFHGDSGDADNVLQGIEDGTVSVGKELREYAEELLDDVGITPELAERYVDYEAIARALDYDGYHEFDGPDGNTYCYRGY